ncbi:MAG TPA: AhpC/TSA family protein [Phototrophicaceae bacterium]|nr:AhpC/TSA family protein [Phototrophicaceae bacterium]
MFCREWLAQLGLHNEELTGAGLQIVAIGQGEPKHITRYCHKLAPKIECLVRDDTTAYRAYGVHQSGFKDFGALDMVKSSVRALSRGHIQGQATGDVAMNPATFIIDTDGLIRYAYYSANAGDHPPISELIAEANKLKKS